MPLSSAERERSRAKGLPRIKWEAIGQIRTCRCSNDYVAAGDDWHVFLYAFGPFLRPTFCVLGESFIVFSDGLAAVLSEVRNHCRQKFMAEHFPRAAHSRDQLVSRPWRAYTR